MRLLILSILLISAVILVGCGDDAPPSCEETGCGDNQVCVNGDCVCDEQFILCYDACIPQDACCRDADCNPGEECIDYQCADPCEDILCPATQTCTGGLCGCEESQRMCNTTCIPGGGCCSDADCSNSSTCIDHICIDKCDTIRCSSKEFCQDGTCHCKEDYFRTESGICLALGLCEADNDCEEGEICVKSTCAENCYSYTEPVEVSECFSRRAAENKDLATCDKVIEDKRDICIHDVAVAKRDRKICLLLPVQQEVGPLFDYTQQNCVVNIAIKAMDVKRCKDIPSSTTLDPDDLEAYCVWEVLDYIESKRLTSIEECEGDCDCRYRFALRAGVHMCSATCEADQNSCLEEFYEDVY